MIKPNPLNDGFTLIELLLAMGLGVLLSALALQCFFMTKQLFMLQQGLARIQENGRVVNLLLGKAVRTAGNNGCNNFTDSITLKVHTPLIKEHYGLHLGQFIHSVDLKNDTNPLIMARVKPRAVFNSDVFWINSISESYKLARPSTAEKGRIFVHGTPAFKEGEVIVIADCTCSDIIKLFESSHSIGAKLNQISLPSSIELSHQYSINAQVNLLASTLYYIGMTGRKNNENQPVYALYSTNLNGQTWELVEGVEAMEIYYRVEGQDGLKAVAQMQVSDWTKIKGVKLKLLLTSVEPCLLKSKSYQVKDQFMTSPDRLLRQWWTYEWNLQNKH